MCAAVLPVLGAVLAVGATAAAIKQSKQANSGAAGAYETYTPEAAADFDAMPEVPTASPVMTTQGGSNAEDQQNATEQQVRKNKQGRNKLRIDKTAVAPGGAGGDLGGGSGVNVPS